MRLSLEPQASLDQVGIVMRGSVQTKVKSQESHFDDHLRSCTLAPEQFETNGQEKSSSSTHQANIPVTLNIYDVGLGEEV